MSKSKASKFKFTPATITGAIAGVVIVVAGIVAVVMNNSNQPQGSSDTNNTAEQGQQEDIITNYSGVEVTDDNYGNDAAIRTLAKLISEYHANWEGGATPEGSFNKTGSFGEYFIQKYLFEGMESEGYKIKYCDHSYTPSYPVFWSSTLGKIDDDTSVCLFNWDEYEEKANNADYYGIKLLLDDDSGVVTISSVNFHGSKD